MDDFLDRLLAIVDVPPLFLNRDIMMLPNENAAPDADDADDNLPNMTTRCKAIISVGWEDNILIRAAGCTFVDTAMVRDGDVPLVGKVSVPVHEINSV